MAKKVVIMTSKGVVVKDTPKEALAVLLEDGIKVTIKQVLAGAVEQAQMVEEENIAAILEAAGIPAPDTAADAPASTDATPGDTPDTLGTPDTPDDSPSDKEYPEVGYFKDEKAMKKYIKKELSDAELFEWCELEGVTWKRCLEHPPIDRMRAAMAIKALHFPDTAPKASSKSKSKYSDYTTEQLVQLALDNDIYVDGDNGDARILRMKTIVALRNAKIID